MTKAKIMIVEDEAIICEEIKITLESMEYNVVETTDTLPLKKCFGSLLLFIGVCLCFVACQTPYSESSGVPPSDRSKKHDRQAAPKAVEGVLDLSDWNFEKDGIIKLDGEWEFYWEQLLEPQDFAKDILPEKTGFVSVPGNWRKYKKFGKKLPEDGFATFSIIVKVSDLDTEYGIKLMRMGTAYRLWTNKILLASNGIVGTSKKTMKPQYRPHVVIFRTDKQKIRIVVQVSNYYYKKAGIFESITLGRGEQIIHKREKNIFFDYLIFGSIFIMALYHFGLYILRRKDPSPLYFCFFCLLMETRILQSGEYFLISLFPDFSWELSYRIDFVVISILPLVLTMFVYSLYQDEFSIKALRIFQFLGIFISSAGVLMPIKIFNDIIKVSYVFIAICCLFIFYILIKATLHKRDGATIFIGGFAVLFITALNDIGFQLLMLRTGEIIYWGLFIFIFIQSYILSLRFSKAFSTVEELSGNLERKVEERTREVQEAQEKLVKIHQITQEVTEHLDLKKATEIFIEKAVKLIRPGGSGSIMLYYEKKNTLTFYAHYGLDPQYIQSFEVKATPEALYTYDVFKSQQSRIFHQEDLKSSQYESNLKIHYGRRYLQQLVAPLISLGKSIGLVSISQYNLSSPFTENDQHVLENLRQSISGHFENVSLYEQTRDREQEITHINQVVQTVNSTLDLDEVLNSVMGALQEFFRFDQIGISLINEETQELIFTHAYGDGFTQEQIEKWHQNRLSLEHEESLYVKTILYNDPNYISHITPKLMEKFLEQDRAIFEYAPTKSVLMYPLEIQNKVIGLISFGNTKESFELVDEDINKIQRYVTQVATAINNAELHYDLKTTKVQLAESEKIASMTQTFEKFVPKQFLKRIAGEGIENIKLGQAQSDIITVLFSDIRSFTALSETMSPQELLNFLNAYLQRMNKPIHDHYGFVDKFIGDAIMALFDLPEESDTEEAQCAVRAAIDMQKALKVYNQHRSNCNYLPIATGIGIHSGPVVIGTVGSEDRMDSTVLGDSVNLASRLEGLTKYYGANIIVSQNTLDLLLDPKEFKYRELDWVKVKGKQESIVIYEILNAKTQEEQKLKRESGTHIKKGLFHRHRRDWKEALESFQKALDIYPEDNAAQLHRQRIQQLRQIDVPDDWDGVIDLEQK
jgi:adenylate cyclase